MGSRVSKYKLSIWKAFFIFVMLIKKIRYTLGATERLKSQKIIEQLFKKGKSFSIFPFRVVWQYQQDSSAILQAGFTVSTRYFKKAVDRNRIRRLMREAYRLQKNELQQIVQDKNKQIAIFIIYTGKELPLYPLISDKTGMVLQRLQKLLNENLAANS